MIITYDKEADVAYIYLGKKYEADSSAETYVLDEHFDFKDMVNIDVDKSGTLLGVEILSASTQLSAELLAEAEVIG